MQEAAAAPDSDGVDLTTLSAMYRVGQCVVVVSVTKDTRFKVVLTLDPAVAMGGRVLLQGELCVAAVASKEDHGYIMDIGCTTVR